MQHGRPNALGFYTLACTVMGRNQTNFPVHSCQLRECISFDWVRNICDHSDTIQDCKRPFASLTSSCCCYDPPLPVLTSFCPNMSFCPQKASNAAQNIGGLEAPGFPSVEKLEEFDWKKTEPLKLRPFKPMYYLTMGKLFDGHRRLLLLRLTWC